MTDQTISWHKLACCLLVALHFSGCVSSTEAVEADVPFTGFEDKKLNATYQVVCRASCADDLQGRGVKDDNHFCREMCTCQFETMKRTIPFREFSEWFIETTHADKDILENKKIYSAIYKCAQQTKHLVKKMKG